MMFVVDSFEQCAARSPDRVALILEDGRLLTYSALNDRVDAVAKVLAQYVKEEHGATQKVAIMMTRDVAFVASVLAILKVNAAYVPVDPSFPVDRQSYIFAHSQCALLLADVASYEAAKQLGVELPLTLVLDAEICTFKESSDPSINISRLNSIASNTTIPKRNLDADRLAYVLYTSGSTGKPKGVMVRQVGVANVINWFAEQMDIGPDSRIMGLTTFSFDISVLEMFLPLTRGSTFVLAKCSTQKDPFRIIELIHSHRINVFQATPTTYEMMLATGWLGDDSIDFLVGGEAFRPTLLPIAALCKSLRNVYGPTETTIWSTSYTIPRSYASISDPKNMFIPIGSAISETDLYVVLEATAADGTWQLATGYEEEGELWIGGMGVSQGYLHAPDLTKDKFLDDPFKSGSRVYRTGDVVKRIGAGPEKGAYAFVRRMDDQVKIDGFRIELQEIENVFASDELLEKVVAGVRNNKLVLYAKTSPSSSPSGRLEKQQEKEMLDRARRSLTHYMVPKHIVYVSDFPQTPNGKLDKKALPDPSREEEGLPLAFPRGVGGGVEVDDAMRYHFCDQPTLLSHITDIIAQTTGRRPLLNSSFAAFGVDSLGAVIFIRTLSVSLDGVRIPPSMVFTPGVTILKFAQTLEAGMLASPKTSEFLERNNFAQIHLLGDRLLDATDENSLEQGESGDLEVASLNRMSKMEMKFDEVIASNIKLFEGARGFLCFMVLWDHYASEYKGRNADYHTPQLQMGADVAMFIVVSGFTMALQLRQAPRYVRDAATGSLQLQKRSPWSWAQFLVSRAVGVFPIAYCGMLLCMPIWYLQDNPESRNPDYQISDQGLQVPLSAQCTVLYMVLLNSFVSPDCQLHGPRALLYASIIWCVFILYAILRTAAVLGQDRVMALKAPSFVLPTGDDNVCAGDYRSSKGSRFPTLTAGRTLREKVGNTAAALVFNRVRTYHEAAALTFFWSVVVGVMWVIVMYRAWAKNALIYLPYFLGGCVGASIVELWHCAHWHAGTSGVTGEHSAVSPETSANSPRKEDYGRAASTTECSLDSRSDVVQMALRKFDWLYFRDESALVNISLFPTAPACVRLAWRHLPDLLAAFSGMACTMVFTWSDCPDSFGADARKDTTKCVSRMFWGWWGLTAFTVVFLVVSMLQRGGDRRNLSRYACESTPLTVMGYISYSCYLFQRPLLEWYLPYFFYAKNQNRGVPKLRFGVVAGDATVLLTQIPWQWRLLLFVILIVGCYLVQWLVQDTLVLYIYAKFLAWRRTVASRSRGSAVKDGTLMTPADAVLYRELLDYTQVFVQQLFY